jgi:RNA polymerase-binding protein DksA
LESSGKILFVNKKPDYSQFKKLLEEVRKKIAGDLEHLEGDSLNQSQRDASGDLSGYSLHIADMATDNFDREFNLGLASNEQGRLNLIDDALRKIEEDKYGICEICAKPIAQKRLLAVPWTRFCIKCQSEEEKKTRRA